MFISGMRILRCFDTCQIDSKYVQNKTFKAGHWHCFACSNAIGSRYDTLLHFKRHLNAFGSSFQVHIVQVTFRKKFENIELFI